VARAVEEVRFVAPSIVGFGGEFLLLSQSFKSESVDRSIIASLSRPSRLNVADFLVFKHVRRLRDFIVTVWQRCKSTELRLGAVPLF
jgi:hypothetical protein